MYLNPFRPQPAVVEITEDEILGVAQSGQAQKSAGAVRI
jgi:hypothetical protein